MQQEVLDILNLALLSNGESWGNAMRFELLVILERRLNGHRAFPVESYNALGGCLFTTDPAVLMNQV
jgi:hypothetical protein